jgi:D-alanine-D-alanine ligase
MIVGLTYDLKEKITFEQDFPEDALEEYDSPETVKGLARILELNGFAVVKLGGGKEFLNNILNSQVDIVFNISEGLGNYRSREAQVPAVLEMLNIPYVGSDPLCLAVCLDKPLTKKIVTLANIPTPKWIVINSLNELSEIDWSSFTFPAFIKPVHEGSSKGIRLSSRVEDDRQARELAIKILKDYQQPVMIEQFIDGDEITVGIMGNSPPKILGLMRVIPKINDGNFIYSIEVKRNWENLVIYECPAQLETTVIKRIEEYSLDIFKVLGCRDFARVDFKVSHDGTPYFLEINPLAGLNPHSSDLPIMAGKIGIAYEQLINSIFNAALDRYPKCVLK